MATQRNQPCSCGSGKKHKACCGDPSKARLTSTPIPDYVLQAIATEREKENARLAAYGDVRPIIHADFQNQKLVAVGGSLWGSERWKTFPDFLFSYVKGVLNQTFGHQWAVAELKKPLERRHPILQWYDALCELQAKTPKGHDGISSAVPDGPTAAYLLLAYDLYVLADNQRLQEAVIRRLKDVNHFQGARYELAVAATMIRAGFDLTFEEEDDNRRKHPEFIATHKRSGEVVAVEAKSRRRSGVMGWIGPKPNREDFRLSLEGLLRDAVKKFPRFPYVIFIDANMPPEIATEEQEMWIQEARQMLSRVGHGYNQVGVFEGVPLTAMVLTNFPHDYGARGTPDPGKYAFLSFPDWPKFPFEHSGTLATIERAVTQYGSVPSDFPDK